jgi:hypothetical protein
MSIERDIWLILIYSLTIWGLVWGLLNTRRIIEAPFLYSVGMSIILCPQLYVAVNHYWRVPQQAFRVFCIMVVFCTIALFWGYFRGNKSASLNIKPPKYRWIIDDNRLFKLGFAIAALGTFGAFQVRSLGEIEGLWRGWPVYWYTLSRLTLPGISLILISYFHSKKTYRLLIALAFSFFPFLAISESGRRSMTLTLPFIYLLPFLIYKPKFKIPRPVVIGSLLAALIVVYAFPYWRGEFREGRYLSVIRERPLTEIVTNMFSGEREKTLEIIDGMILTGAHYELNRYGFGVDRVYNSLIHRYVPGGLLGYDFKESLMIGSGISRDWVTSVYDIPVAFYTAKTAFSELFGEFSFFGAIAFFYVGFLFGRAYASVIYYFDGRAIIFLAFFITLPAALPYGSLLNNLVTQLPNIIIMLTAFRWCLIKYPSLSREKLKSYPEAKTLYVD